MHDDLKAFFLDPKTSKQRQYEALRAYVLDERSANEVACRFGFTEASVYALAHDLRSGALDLFPKQIAGPKDRRVTPYVRELISDYRKKEMSVAEIQERLTDEFPMCAAGQGRVFKRVGIPLR